VDKPQKAATGPEVIPNCDGQKLCCRSCGRWLFSVKRADFFHIEIKCPRCGKIAEIIVGASVQIEP